VLLRPDGHIAWFTPTDAVDREVAVAAQLVSLLGRAPNPAVEERPATLTTAEHRARQQQATPVWRRSRRTSSQG
jgi:hypothetical protein